LAFWAPKIPDIANFIPVRLLKIPVIFLRDFERETAAAQAFRASPAGSKGRKLANTLLFSLLAGK
jgi:cobalamin biosynthesis protein CobD/CbiB